MNNGKTLKRVVIGTLCVIVGVAAVFYIGLRSKLKEFSDEVSKIEMNSIDLTGVEDGTYSGEFDFDEMVGAAVDVTVEKGIITAIKIINHKSSGFGKKAEAIVNSVIQKQSLQVDAISGATGSSKIILKAIEKALVQ
ncbi:FMN-binding protein [Alkaliphilus serpentinus]|uniref:FMN-binding protein n=1 Tax=Alkaliphilus serpentinus TaxID=1482731 RepID=A0A833HQC6_9FIRM|nr:FMN-binding protein [Alkaliphilus serpentinus]KAB3531557.1 FMN-binding protein [Alkaliphilus serpentinus]